MTRLSQLAKLGGLAAMGEGDPEITAVTEDSRDAGPGSLFAALKGLKFDGRDFASQAAQKGAAAVLLEGDDMPGLAVPRLVAPRGRVRPVMALLSAAVYGHPADKLIMVGLTGTNGKTTTAYLMEAMLARAGLNPGVMGTINFRGPGFSRPAPNTTPEGPAINACLAEMVAGGAKSAVLEVSSHALALGRVAGLAFDAALFTNLTREHLDFHADMEEYYAAKKLLFTKYLRPGPKKAAINVDDPYGARLARELGDAAVTFGFRGGAEVAGSDLRLSREGLSFTVTHPGGSWRQTSPLLAEINGYNLLGAAALGLAMKLGEGCVSEALAACHGAPGRLEKVGRNSDYLVLVDYAHSPDALDKALDACRALKPRRVIAVFGCGGDRDRGKRPIMGKIAGEKADFTVITSDNPRTEEPLSIMRQVEAGLTGDHAMIADRPAAIAEGVRLMGPGDVLLVAGKGHEDYQIVGREKHHLDDREEAAAALKALGRL